MEKEKFVRDSSPKDFQELLNEIYSNLTTEEKEYSLKRIYGLVERFPANVRDRYFAILDEKARLIEEEKNEQNDNHLRR